MRFCLINMVYKVKGNFRRTHLQSRKTIRERDEEMLRCRSTVHSFVKSMHMVHYNNVSSELVSIIAKQQKVS